MASGCRQPARWLPGTLKKPPSRIMRLSVIGRRRRDLDAHPVLGEPVLRDWHAEIATEGRALVLGAAQAAALQLGDHHVDPFLERLWVVREKQIEAVGRALVVPLGQVLGD